MLLEEGGSTCASPDLLTSFEVMAKRRHGGYKHMLPQMADEEKKAGSHLAYHLMGLWSWGLLYRHWAKQPVAVAWNTHVAKLSTVGSQVRRQFLELITLARIWNHPLFKLCCQEHCAGQRKRKHLATLKESMLKDRPSQTACKGSKDQGHAATNLCCPSLLCRLEWKTEASSCQNESTESLAA